LSVMLSEPVRVPIAFGENLTVTVHLLPAVRLVPQVLVCEKSPEFVPVIAMLVMVMVAVPVLLRVTAVPLVVWPGMTTPKLIDVGDREAKGAGAAPVPVKAAVCGLPAALSVIDTEAVRVPAAVGLNVTLMEHLAPAVTEAPQVFVSAKSPLLVPVIAMALMVKVVLPELVKVMV
jgi:hypothetical protein